MGQQRKWDQFWGYIFSEKNKYLRWLFASWGLYFIIIFSRIISWRGTGIYAAHENVWSDWALHIGLTTTFAEKHPSDWFAYHPFYADGKMTYTFLTNFISGMMMRAGFSLELAMILPSIAYSLLLILGMHRFLTMLLSSERRSFIAISLFFLASGMGFILFITDFLRDPQILSWFVPPRQYSRLDAYGWYAGNFIVGHLLPQRSMLIGMTLTVWSLAGLLSVIQNPKSSKNRMVLVRSAVFAGLLPIAHMHSLIAMIFLMGPILLVHFRRWKEFLYFLLPGGALAAILYFTFIWGGIERPDFFRWAPGYTTKSFWDWITFWFWVWGFMLPVAAVGLIILWRKISVELRCFVLSAWVLFFVCNLIWFQPISWDNSKLFAWCYFAFSGMAAFFLDWLWRHPKKDLFKLKSVVAVLFFFLTATGMLELELLQRVSTHTFQMISNEELFLGDQVRKSTGPRDRFLTAADHNHWVMMRGVRPILLGYTAWVLNFGFLYGQTEKDIQTIYQGGEEAKRLLALHRVHYVVIGPSEIRNFKPKEEFFLQTYKIAFQSPNYRVFDVEAPIGK